MSAAFELLGPEASDDPIGVIPVSVGQWRRSVLDAKVDARLSAWAVARGIVAAKALDDDASLDRGLRLASMAFVAEVRLTCGSLRLLATLDPGTSGAPRLAHEWQTVLLEDAQLALEAAVDKLEPPPPPALLSDQLDVRDEGEQDVLYDLFGVPADELIDETGSFCDTRVLASYRLRLGQLQHVCDPIMGLVAERPPSVFTAVSAVRDLATSTSPLITLWAAREIRSRILDAFDADPMHARSILSEAAKDGDKEWESFRRMQRCLRRAEDLKDSSSGTEAEYAIAILEAYRHMAEGITRRWVGVLLRLSGLKEAPGIGAISEPATSRLGELGARIAVALVPAMRNAEAHDDFVFDEDSGQLVSEDAAFDPEQILARLTDLDILQRGLIVGRLAAFADQPALAERGPGTVEDLSPGSALVFARQRFGDAGQQVRSFVRDRDRLEVVIDDLRPEACNPCFVALTQTAHVLTTVRHFAVRVRGKNRPVIDLPASVLEQNWEAFELAANCFPDGLPQVTFLPCTTWCRLSCETVEEAARFAAWFALNDASHAILDANASIVEYRRIPARFAVVIAAGAATVRLLPEGPHLDHLLRAIRIVQAAERVLLRDPEGAAVRVLTNRIFGMGDDLGGPFAVLPTLDTTPLQEGSFPHEIS